MAERKNDWGPRARAAWKVLTGRQHGAVALPPVPDAGAAVSAGAAGADLRPRVAGLELDLRERDAELARVRVEYARRQAQAERELGAAAAAGLDALARQLAPLLSQLATMQALAEAARPLRVEDTLKLFAKVEHVLTAAGLERIGSVGQNTPFDTRLHQRMSGADVHDNAAVTVRFVGYRLGETVLLKAMVSRHEAAAGAPRQPPAEGSGT